ncbi:MAG: hypothetical protein HY537_05220, partial [Deltaproteobacteria bacterium]|nr:hypothetical protein [Deltaproteobacteria bacterium]
LSHTDLFLEQIDPIFFRSEPFQFELLSNHSWLAYLWYPWQRSQGATGFRYELDKAQSSFEQIIQFLNSHPNRRLMVLSDSGGPYKKMRGSLVKLAVQTERPLIALKMKVDRFRTIHHHKIPLFGATIQPVFSRPIHPGELRELSKEAALRIVQMIWEEL